MPDGLDAQLERMLASVPKRVRPPRSRGAEYDRAYRVLRRNELSRQAVARARRNPPSPERRAEWNRRHYLKRKARDAGV